TAPGNSTLSGSGPIGTPGSTSSGSVVGPSDSASSPAGTTNGSVGDPSLMRQRQNTGTTSSGGLGVNGPINRSGSSTNPTGTTTGGSVGQ
ncbi:MAG TPA: hypothetical protein VE029_13325, partial [Rhizobacter sp.]|nr:hypothetical protein [Rhizobacter sp.]